jgi:hypothetical protein
MATEKDLVRWFCESMRTKRIEAKDGTKGYRHVLAGIGQVGLYAVQLGMTKRAVTRIQRALLWTSTDNILSDALVEEVCEQAGVISLPWGDMRKLEEIELEARSCQTAKP